MKLPPKSVLKSWPKPNYVNPETRGNSLLVFNSVFLALVTICLVLRLYTRLVVKRWLGWDDFFITCAYVSCVGALLKRIRISFFPHRNNTSLLLALIVTLPTTILSFAANSTRLRVCRIYLLAQTVCPSFANMLAADFHRVDECRS